MNESIFPAFQDEWQKKTGEHIELIFAFAGSGTLTQIQLGVPAQVAILATGLWSPPAQQFFAEAGFRSIDDQYNGAFRALEKPFTVADLGGWPRARAEIIEEVWKARVLAVLGK